MKRKDSRPDILLLMPDQMRGDCLSALGHPVVRTPNFDRLARQGVVFRRAYSTVPSCIPARFALLTGLFPQTSGVVGFDAKPITPPTLPGVLAEAGYRTVLVGRNMHQKSASGDCGYQQSLLGSTYVEGDDYDRFLRAAAPETGGIRRLVEDLGVTYNHWQAKPWPLSEQLHPTNWTVAESCQAGKAAELDQPLFLTASFYAPHPPLFPPKRYFEHYFNQPLPEPCRGRWVDWGTLSPDGDANGHRVRLEDDALRSAQAGYFGLIEHIDAQIDALVRLFIARSERAGRAWVIVVTSDHGEMLGDHGYFRKCQPYEGSANIPMVIAGSPELGFQAGTQIDRPVCLEDLMPTLVALAGTAQPEYLDGADLTGALRGQLLRIRDWLHFEHAPCYNPEQAFHALTDGRYKYIWRPHDGREQLFDLNHDPQERHDMASDGVHHALMAKWRERLTERLAGRPEGFSQAGALIAGCPYPRLNPGTLELA